MTAEAVVILDTFAPDLVYHEAATWHVGWVNRPARCNVSTYRALTGANSCWLPEDRARAMGARPCGRCYDVQ